MRAEGVKDISPQHTCIILCSYPIYTDFSKISKHFAHEITLENLYENTCCFIIEYFFCMLELRHYFFLFLKLCLWVNYIVNEFFISIVMKVLKKMYNKREAGSDGVKIFGTRGKKQMTNSDTFVA